MPYGMRLCGSGWGYFAGAREDGRSQSPKTTLKNPAHCVVPGPQTQFNQKNVPEAMLLSWPKPEGGLASSCFYALGSPAATTAQSLQSCPTLCDPIDGSPPGSPIPGILQARILGWVAISFSNAWKWKVKVKSLSRVRPSATPWTAAFQAPLSMGFSRQEYWSGVPLGGQKWFHELTK